MIGTQVGRYRIESEIGRGGMGVVYRGIQVTLDRPVAIKMLPAHLADPDNRERFRREALTLARLAHPNIVHIYDVEDLDGSSFIVMEHVGGGSLGDLLRSGPVPPGRAMEIMGPILSALQAAHLAGIVHRDIKPDNILFGDGGRPKLTDFGIAHMRDGGGRTRTGVMLGTPYYMSPEQARGQKVSERTDLYAVGVVLYEMLTGRVPFTGEDPMAVALQHVQTAARPLAELRPELPPDLCALVHRALEKEPGARFGSAAAMQDALESGSWAPLRASDPGSAGWGVVDRPGGDAPPSPPSVPPSPQSTWGTGDHAERLARAVGTGLDRARMGGRTAAEALLRPAWRGLPLAFWTGVVVVAVAVLGIGVSAAMDRAAQPPSSGSTGEAPPTSEATNLPAPSPPSSVDPGGVGGGASPPARSGNGTPTRPAPGLTGDDMNDLVAIVGGGREAPDEEAPTDDRAERAIRALDPEPRTPPVTDERAVPEDPPPETPPAETAEEAARLEILAIVERQRRAVETIDRALFLRDIHPDSRGEAAEIFDGGFQDARNLRSTVSDIEIDFLDPDHAYVAFDVELTYVVRSDGRTVRDSVREEWDVIREGGTWWILTWN